MLDTKVSPAGNWSVTATFVAASGPPLFSVIVNVTSSPTFGVAASTVLVSDRSTCSELIAALSWSSSPGVSLPGVESGSTSLAVATCAVFTSVPAASTVAVIVSVSVA